LANMRTAVTCYFPRKAKSPGQRDRSCHWSSSYSSRTHTQKWRCVVRFQVDLTGIGSGWAYALPPPYLARPTHVNVSMW